MELIVNTLSGKTQRRELSAPVQRDNDVMCHVTVMCQSDAMMMKECMLSRG